MIMSLGDVTKCDLDADIAKLDLKALSQSLNFMFVKLAQEIYTNSERMAHCIRNEDVQQRMFECTVHEGKQLAHLIDELRQVSELAHTAHEALNSDRQVHIVYK